MRFKGSKEYVSTDDLSIAVNAAINLEKPISTVGGSVNPASSASRRMKVERLN